jgi:hypothetical protein
MTITYVATEARRTQRYVLQRRPSVSSVPPWLRTLILIPLASVVLQAHSGPPFPIVTDRIAGAYQISIWTDPDATDDQSAAGKFWVMMQPARPNETRRAIPPGTRVEVTIRPLDRQGGEKIGQAEPVNADVARQFVALVMDHEGPFGVRVAVDGPLGKADIDASTDATYDLRPRPILMVLFVMPFLLVGFVWGKLLIRRGMHARGGRLWQKR